MSDTRRMPQPRGARRRRHEGGCQVEWVRSYGAPRDAVAGQCPALSGISARGFHTTMTTHREHDDRHPPGPPDSVVDQWQGENGRVIDLLRLARQHGALSSVRLRDRRIVLITHPDHILHVLARRESHYQKTTHRARELLGQGLLSSTGTLWAHQRRLLQSRFTVAGVRRREGDITAAARRIHHRWERAARSGGSINLSEDLEFFTLDTVWRNITSEPLRQETYRLLRGMRFIVDTLSSAVSNNTGLPAKSKEILAEIDAIIYELISRETHSIARKDGLVHLLIRSARDNPEINDQLIRDEIITFIVAGYETTATTLTWAILMLAEHPSVEEWVLDTLHREGRDGFDRAITAVVMETLRLYPTVWIIPRQVVADDVIDGWKISTGDTALICPYFTHREPDLWSEPERFDPQRFTGTERHWKPGAYHPFGLGPRSCIGQHFAMRESVTLLSLMVRAFRITIHHAPRTGVFGAVLRPEHKPLANIHPRDLPSIS
ncbi:MAG: cytochrome P450 [Pseudonocardiaceae bacterium]